MSKNTRIAEIAADLERRIYADEFPVSEKLPATRTLGKQYVAAEGTIAAAVRVLVRKGLVTPVRSYGTVVRDWRRPRQVRRQRGVYRDSAGFYFDHTAQAWAPTAHASRVSWEPATDYVAELLGIDPGQEVLIRERVVGEETELAPGRKHVSPQQICSTTVPADIAREHDLGRADTGPGGVLVRLAEALGGLDFEDVTYSRFATKHEIQSLNLGGGEVPVLGIATTGIDPAGRVVVVNDVRMDGRRWMIGHRLQQNATDE